jgi:hypothetical protein
MKAKREGIDTLVWYRHWFRALNQEKRRLFIAERSRTVSAGAGGDAQTVWSLETPVEMGRMLRSGKTPHIEVAGRAMQEVCGDFFCYVLGVAKSKLYQPTVPSPTFQTSLPRAARGNNPDKPGKAYWVVMWILHLAQFYLHDPAADRIILPFADRRAVYDMYLHENEDEEGRERWSPEGVVSRSWFYDAWSADPGAHKVKVRKTLRFSLCPECVGFINTRMHVLSDLDRNAAKAAEGLHHRFVRRERGSYYGRRWQAVHHPTTCFSIIIDGADQSAFGSPHFAVHSKDDDGHWKVATHLMGALVHGKVAHGYTFLPNIKHGSNVTIETLHRVLLHEFARGGGVPFTQRMLYLQLDNTTKQCKSQFVLGYLALLVAWGVFDEVVLSFLPVGHTHEDIDQMFSRIAEWLRKHDATSRIGFREAILAGFKGKWTGNVVAGDIERASNLSHWLPQFLNSMEKKSFGPAQREGITKFHQFRFSLLQGVPIMRVREWCGDEEAAPWGGLEPESTHHVVFAEIPTPGELAETCPPAQRSAVPDDEAHIERFADGRVKSTYASKTRTGVEAIIANRGISGDEEADLQRCLDLLDDATPLEFDWDMSMYNEHYRRLHQELLPPQSALVQARLGEDDVSADSAEDASGDDAQDNRPNMLMFQDSDPDDHAQVLPDEEGFVPKPLGVQDTHLVRMGGTDWGLAKIMGAPFIEEGSYAVYVMWLDPCDLNKGVADPFALRYLPNKRGGHSRGWEKVQAASIDCKMSTIKDGNYFKLAHTQKAVIVGRIQSWMLVDNEKGALPPEVVLPTVDRKLRPGQTKPKEMKRRASGANKAKAPKATTASKSKPTKMAKPNKRALAVIAKKRNDASSDSSAGH